MNLEGQKISGSRNWAVWGLDFLSRYDPDPLRFYLTANMPELRDSDWDWAEFVARNNNELVATWGNLANRVLAFTYKNWDGVIPDPGELRPADQAILATIESGFQSVGEHLEAVRLRQALYEALRLASEVNKYLDTAAPWFEIKSDKAAAAKTVYTALRCIDSLKTLLSPVLPFSSQQLHTFLGYTDAAVRRAVHRGAVRRAGQAQHPALPPARRGWQLGTQPAARRAGPGAARPAVQEAGRERGRRRTRQVRQMTKIFTAESAKIAEKNLTADYTDYADCADKRCPPPRTLRSQRKTC